MTDLSYIAEGLRSLAVPLDCLHEDPANARVGHDVDRIAASLRQYGQRKPIVANRLQEGKIEAGNGTYRAAVRLGWTHIAVVYVDDDPATAAAYGIADNRVAEFSRWDEEVLKELAANVGDLFTGFEPVELDELVGRSVAVETPPTVQDPGADPDRADELQAKWQVQPGQIWNCGPHRVMCGDATSRPDMQRLMENDLAHLIWSDPPWNVNYGGGVDLENKQGYRVRTMNNDNLGEKFPEFVLRFTGLMYEFSRPGALVYLVMGAQEWPVIDQALRARGFHWSSTVVWVKDALVLSRKDYHGQYEPMWYGWRGDAGRLHEVLDRKQSDVWQINRPKRSEEHPTMKPLELVERSVRNSSQPGWIVLDPFAGSGTSLVACERLGRVCRTMDNDPRFVAVCLERWHQATGRDPEHDGWAYVDDGSGMLVRREVKHE